MIYLNTDNNTSYTWCIFIDSFYFKEKIRSMKYSGPYLLGTSHDDLNRKIYSNSCLQADSVANGNNVLLLCLSFTLWKIQFSYIIFFLRGLMHRT